MECGNEMYKPDVRAIVGHSKLVTCNVASK